MYGTWKCPLFWRSEILNFFFALRVSRAKVYDFGYGFEFCCSIVLSEVRRLRFQELFFIIRFKSNFCIDEVTLNITETSLELRRSMCLKGFICLYFSAPSIILIVMFLTVLIFSYSN